MKKLGKLLQLAILALLTSFLIARAITNIFIGIGIIILLLAIYIGYLIVKRPLYERNVSLSSLAFFSIGSITLGGFWMLDRINRSKDFLNELISLYFEILDSIKWEFKGTTSFTYDVTLEKMQGINFWSASLFLFIGIAFCLPWFLPKIVALIRGINSPTIIIWVLTFFMIWITYYFQGSLRYLSPMFIPYSILVVHGFSSLLEYFRVSTESLLPRLLLLFLGCANFYYLIPLNSNTLGDNNQEIVGEAYNRSAFSFYSHPEIALLQALIFTIVWIILLFILNNQSPRLFLHLKRFLKDKKPLILKNFIPKIELSVTILLFLTIITIPIAVQGFVWIQSRGDLTVFQGTMEYEYNEDYQAVVEKISILGNPTGAILCVRMPGLQFFTQKAALDFYYQGSWLGDDFYTSENISFLIEVLKEPIKYLLPSEYHNDLPFDFSFEFIVVPNTENIYYDIYIENIWSKSIFFQSLTNTTYFQEIYSNSRYQLFRIN